MSAFMQLNDISMQFPSISVLQHEKWLWNHVHGSDIDFTTANETAKSSILAEDPQVRPHSGVYRTHPNLERCPQTTESQQCPLPLQQKPRRLCGSAQQWHHVWHRSDITLSHHDEAIPTTRWYVTTAVPAPPTEATQRWRHEKKTSQRPPRDAMGGKPDFHGQRHLRDQIAPPLPAASPLTCGAAQHRKAGTRPAQAEQRGGEEHHFVIRVRRHQQSADAIIPRHNRASRGGTAPLAARGAAQYRQQQQQ